MTNLVDESGELITDNEQITPLQTIAEDYTDKNWEPEPVDAGPGFRAHKPSDVVSTLVSIYDSKDLFVRELQNLLGQKLLNIKDGNFEKEVRGI
jgi:anaphase-promoting complex subunit 2